MHRHYAGFYSIDNVLLQCCYIVLQCFVTVVRHSVDSIGSEESVDSVFWVPCTRIRQSVQEVCECGGDQETSDVFVCEM